MKTKTLELGKRHSWKDIVAAYPDLWVFLADYKPDPNGFLLSGVLLAVCEYKERDAKAEEFEKQGIDCAAFRTTFNEDALGVRFC